MFSKTHERHELIEKVISVWKYYQYRVLKIIRNEKKSAVGNPIHCWVNITILAHTYRYNVSHVHTWKYIDVCVFVAVHDISKISIPTILLTFSEQDFNVDVKVIQADFSKGQKIFDQISKELEGIEIGILGQWRLR